MPNPWDDPDYLFHVTSSTGDYVVDNLPADGNPFIFLKAQWSGNPGLHHPRHNGQSFDEVLNDFIFLVFGPEAQSARPRSAEAFRVMFEQFAYTSPPTIYNDGSQDNFFPTSPYIRDGENLFDHLLKGFLDLGPHVDASNPSALSSGIYGQWDLFLGDNSNDIPRAKFLTVEDDFLVGPSADHDLQHMYKAFNDSFSQFLTTFVFKGIETNIVENDPTNPLPYKRAVDVAQPAQGSPVYSFIEGYKQWMQRTTVPEFADLAGPNADLQVYQRIYESYLPNADPSFFQKEIISFADRMYEEEGYFYPTHFVERWVDELKSASLSSTSRTIIDPIFLEERVNQALILNQVFDLLVDMIGIIQQATAALAQRLRFFSEYQNQLTKLMDQVQIFHSGDEGELSEADTEVIDEKDVKKYEGARADANAKSQAALEYLRAHRDMVGDETKQLQTTVNQLNDAASQQGNIATAILQQLSGILTLIFR